MGLTLFVFSEIPSQYIADYFLGLTDAVFIASCVAGSLRKVGMATISPLADFLKCHMFSILLTARFELLGLTEFKNSDG